MRSILGLPLLLMSCASATSQPEAVNQIQLEAIGQSLEVNYKVLSNLADAQCRVHIPAGDCFSAQITLDGSSVIIPASTSLYFNHIAPVRGFEASSDITIEHLNGDLHRLTFNQDIAADGLVSVTLSAPFWHASRSDAMPNYYLKYPSLNPVIVTSTTRVVEPGSELLINQHTAMWGSPQQYKRADHDNTPLMDSEYFYARDTNQITRNTQNAENTFRVIPKVARRNDSGERIFVSGIRIDKYVKAQLAPAIAQMKYFDLSHSDSGLPVSVSFEPNRYRDSQYALSVTNDEIVIAANNAVGANYALLTLMQLYNGADKTLPFTEINDIPRYDFRGMHIDIARHFPGKAAIESVIRQMFTYKLNKLHLHLSDDEGWRLAIDTLPELTQIGAYRCHDPSETACLMPQLGSGPYKDATGNGFLTKQEYISLVKFAHQRGIEIIPSLDMPGHARAAIVAMNARYSHFMAEGDETAANQYLLVDKKDPTQYESIQFYRDNTINPCLDSSYTFIETVMTAVKQMHDQANVRLKHFHVGADETAGAWVDSPVCHAKGKKPATILPEFLTRVQGIAKALNIDIGGWSDGMEKAVPTLDNSHVYTNVWHLLAAGGENTVSYFANSDIPVVLSFPDVLYFDFPYINNPYEPGYYWGSKATRLEKVFSLMPANLALHSKIWPDRMGHRYTSSEAISNSSVIGIQGQLWTEVTINQAAIEYMLFPRLLVLAERAWHHATWQKNAAALIHKEHFEDAWSTDWYAFNDVLTTRHMPALVKQDINVRVPIPGAVIRNGKLHMKHQLGLVMEYQLPDGEWLKYTQPVGINGRVLIRSRLEGTHKTSRQVQL